MSKLYPNQTLSQLGYKRHSPYNKAPSLLINTPSGSITMKEVDHPIIGIGKGEIKFMLPNKEYQFKSNKVLEIPMKSIYPKKYQQGGETVRQGNMVDDYFFNPLIKKAGEFKDWAVKKATPMVSSAVAWALPEKTPQAVREHIYNSYDTVKYPDLATAFSQYGWGNRDLKKHHDRVTA